MFVFFGLLIAFCAGAYVGASNHAAVNKVIAAVAGVSASALAASEPLRDWVGSFFGG